MNLGPLWYKLKRFGSTAMGIAPDAAETYDARVTRPWWMMMKSKALGTALLMGLVLSVSACASRSDVSSPFDGPTASTRSNGAEDPIRIEVQNLNFNDVTIWAVRTGQRVRLGRVTGKTDESFRIDWNVAIPISFVIDVVGGRSCTTGQVGVEPNARVWLTVPGSVGVQPCRVGRR